MVGGYGRIAVASYCLIFCAIHPSYSNFLYIILNSERFRLTV